MTTYKPVPAVKNAVKIVDCIVDAKGGLRGLEVARMTGINPSTCYNILYTLSALGVVSYDENKKTFSEGVWLYEKYKKSALKLKSIPGLSGLFNDIVTEHPGGVCTLWRILDSRCVLVEKQAGTESRTIRLAVGQRMPRYLGAFGRALAAVDGISPEQVKEVIASIDYDAKPTPDEFVSDMRFFLRNGYSVDAGRYVRGITAISSLLYGSSDEPVYALSYVGQSDDLDDNLIASLGERLHEFAARY